MRPRPRASPCAPPGSSLRPPSPSHSPHCVTGCATHGRRNGPRRPARSLHLSPPLTICWLPACCMARCARLWRWIMYADALYARDAPHLWLFVMFRATRHAAAARFGVMVGQAARVWFPVGMWAAVEQLNTVHCRCGGAWACDPAILKPSVLRCVRRPSTASRLCPSRAGPRLAQRDGHRVQQRISH